MFQFPRFAFVSYEFRNKYLLVISVSPKTTRPDRAQRPSSELQRSKVGFPIRKSADQSLFAAPHGLSQRTTSFIASQRQGIHRIPLRHLIALIIDVHRSAADRSLIHQRAWTRLKTSLLQMHPRTVRSSSVRMTCSKPA